MASSRTSNVSQHLRRAALLQDGAGLTDGQLLGCFLEQRDAAAFAALVKRHGPMVWGVCRRLLGHHDAEDAFQATFLVLFRKAASVRPREALANWLYGVARLTALHARRVAARRDARERQVTDMPEPAAAPPEPGRDLQALLDQELGRLPDKYRLVIVLCDLEGRTRKEAARQLGCPEGTVAGRLARARGMLARRLARQGVLPAGGALAALAQEAASAAAPPALVASTIQAGGRLAAGEALAAGLGSTRAAALTEGVLKAMLLTKLKAATAVLLALAVVGGGSGALLYRAGAAVPAAAGGNAVLLAQDDGAQNEARDKKQEDPAGNFLDEQRRRAEIEKQFLVQRTVKEASQDIERLLKGLEKDLERETGNPGASLEALEGIERAVKEMKAEQQKQRQTQPPPIPLRYDDFAELNHGGNGATATGLREKGGFTVVPLKSAKGGSAFALSFAAKKTELGGEPDFRVVAVDGNGKRHKARSESAVSAGGNGIVVVTLLPEFDLTSDNIKSFVIQRRVK